MSSFRRLQSGITIQKKTTGPVFVDLDLSQQNGFRCFNHPGAGVIRCDITPVNFALFSVWIKIRFDPCLNTSRYNSIQVLGI